MAYPFRIRASSGIPDYQMPDDAALTPDSPDPDLPLVQAALGGDFAAMEVLVGRYERRIYALAMRIVRNDADAQDVVQQTLLTVVEKLDGFGQRSRFAPWILRIATNQSLWVLRKRKSSRMVRLDDALETEPMPHPNFIAQWKQDPAELASNAEVGRLISDALDALDEKYRMVFLLRDVQGLSTKETSQALGISVSNVKVRLLRARLMLRETLTAVLGDPGSAVRHEHPA